MKVGTTIKGARKVTLFLVLRVRNRNLDNKAKVRQATLNYHPVIHLDMDLASNNLHPVKPDLRNNNSSNNNNNNNPKIRMVDDPCNHGGMPPILAKDHGNNHLPCSPSTEATLLLSSNSDLVDLLVSTHLGLEVRKAGDHHHKLETHTWDKLDRGSHFHSAALLLLSNDNNRSPRLIRGHIQGFRVICRPSFNVSCQKRTVATDP